MVAQPLGDDVALAGNARRQVRRRGDLQRLAPDPLPALEQRRRILLQPLGRHARRRGAHDDPAIEQPFHKAAQSLALGLAVDAARKTETRACRVIDEIAAGDRDIHGEARPLLGIGVAAHLDEHRRTGQRPVLLAGKVFGTQEAGAASTDIDESGIEVGHDPLHPAEEDALDQRRPVAPRHLQFDQASLAHQRNQMGPRQGVQHQAVDGAHGICPSSAPSSMAVSNSGRPTTLL